MKQPLTLQELLLNLKAAGFGNSAAEEYLACWRAGETKQQLTLLGKKRAALLRQIHRRERQIDCLDYLVYRIEHQAPGG